MSSPFSVLDLVYAKLSYTGFARELAQCLAPMNVGRSAVFDTAICFSFIQLQFSFFANDYFSSELFICQKTCEQTDQLQRGVALDTSVCSHQLLSEDMFKHASSML